MKGARAERGRTAPVAIGAWCVAIFIALVLSTQAASARPGELDESFGEGGRAATAADLGSSWRAAAIHLATAPDSSTIVASGRQLIRYLPNGQLDPSFGEGGKVTLEEVEGLSFRLGDVSIDGEGHVVAFGTAIDPSTSFSIPFYPTGARVNPTFAVVLRYDATGRLDPSFGGGDGVVRTDLGLQPTLHAESGSPPPLVRLVSGEVDSQDRPMLVAASAELVSAEHGSLLVWPSRLVIRLTWAGTLDPSFGRSGIVELSSTKNRGLAIGTESEPLLVWGGFPSAEPLAITQITRLRGDGTADSDYGAAGMRTIDDGGGAAVLDRFGRLLIVGRPGQSPAHVLRLRPDGRLDRRFGQGGLATVKMPGKRTALSSIAVDARGRVLLAGTAMRRRTVTTGFEEPREQFAVGRLRPSGRVDQSFGHKGWVRTGFGRHTKVAGAREVFATQGWDIDGPQAVVDRRGRVVVAAAGHSPQLEPGGIILARYLPGG
jgi:uncharacterized delta-60 repeat protein